MIVSGWGAIFVAAVLGFGMVWVILETLVQTLVNAAHGDLP